MNTRLKNSLKTSIKVVVSATLLYLVFSKLGVESLWQTLKQSSLLSFITAFLLVLGSKWLSHIRLINYLKSIDLIVPQLMHWKLYLQGMFYNLFLPGGIGGDAYKAYVLSKQYPVKIKRIIAALFLDRLSGLVALTTLTLLLCSIYFGLYFPIINTAIKPIAPVIRFAVVLSPFVILGFYAVHRIWFRYALGVFYQTTLGSFVLQGLQVIAAYILLLGLGNFENAWPFLLLFTLSSMLSVLPLSIGGIGLREITFFYGAQWLQLDSEVGVALSVLFFSVNALVSLIGLPYHFKPVFKAIV
ncbi:MAG: lysylphosphatidylglycerol synthase transmembrane domain-containing protein [Bacteroidetes bacterium]|nr:lysylphosphatidylglycerol synthase transmembrane domain-containing protein [Bacteroidota bacterium]